ncbi:hypothetical protein [Microbacterium gubbeenense]|uniref:hypothetical protein n=1 Tax=Microbacterium gubbeenense TaxID=159896 RepID=UPI00048CF804|nr:hypothetical protein [Microbacterium gubbeenense]
MSRAKVVPADVRLAAKRGFVRTATQALSSVIPLGAIAIPTTGDALLGIGLAAGGALVSAALAGAASALDIISKGVPEEYQTTR